MSDDKMREALLKCKTCALPTEVRDLVIAALAEQLGSTRKPVLAVYGDKIREGFEAWISAPPFEKSIKRLPMDEKLTSWPGAYRPIEVELAWEAWQAALAEQPAQGEAVAWRDHVEHRIRTWRQSFINRSGDQLAIDDFMGAESIDDLVEYVCDAYTAPPAPIVPEGWKLVPERLTPQMAHAGDATPDDAGWMQEMWTNMLAVSPEPRS